MKKIFTSSLIALTALSLQAQSPRVTLYEEFTGETCPPCASTNPGLNTLLLASNNATRIIAIKWQVPIPSAPSNTWSLYQTDKTEIDWRWKSIASGGYGYLPAINSAPSSKMDGQEATVFGASSGHPANLNNTVISNAVSKASSFNIIMKRDVITALSTAAVVNVTIQATAPYSTTGNLVFRNVLVERLINFSVQPGTNGEKNFEDPARKSYPTLQAGTALPQTWTQGQIMTFSMNCVFPSYINSNLQIEFVGFIQNDATQKVEQVCRTSMPQLGFDAVASSVNPPFLCSVANTMAPTVPMKNDGQSAITAATITPYIDGVAKTPTQWTGNIEPGFSGFVQLDPFTSATTSGLHTFSYTISGLNSTDNNMSNNGASGTYYGVYNYQATPIAEGFSAGGWPYAAWYVNNLNGGASTWSYASGVESYNIGSGNSMKYDFYKNTVLGDKDELILPPIDLTGVGQPQMSFDVAYKLRTTSSNDKLEVLASSNCGSTWQTVWSAQGNALAINQTPDPAEFLTTGTNDWTTVNFNLPGFNKPSVLVKFVTTNRNGNNLYLDNINLASSSIPDGIKNNSAVGGHVNVYPNPSSGISNVVITSPITQVAKLSVLNSLGQVVFEKDVQLNAGNNQTLVDLSSFSSGIYSLNITGDNVRAVTRITLCK
ncbi:MAG: T9SS type A sorting domain-containing protein [bacterium]|nr:T9SS type A sorting domain-containing protein [bacterium]